MALSSFFSPTPHTIAFASFRFAQIQFILQLLLEIIALVILEICVVLKLAANDKGQSDKKIPVHRGGMICLPELLPGPSAETAAGTPERNPCSSSRVKPLDLRWSDWPTSGSAVLSLWHSGLAPLCIHPRPSLLT